MKNIGNKILKIIKEKHIKPKPKWEFLLKNYLIWTIFSLAIIVGSLSTAVVIFIIRNYNWVENHEFGLLKNLIINIPYFWMIILVLFLFIAYYNFKHTKTGYRYNPYLIIIVSILISLILGSTIYATGFGETLERIFYQRLPFYQNIMHQGGRMFLDPNQGRLAGIISEIKNNKLIVESFDGDQWTVLIDDADYFDINMLQPETRVMIMGKMIENNTFEAEMIRPWFGPKHMRDPGQRIHRPMPPKSLKEI